ncbi:MAG: ankyrin repeat domain-containing protein [Epsilonproteobacteria bacterium]|nr:ankyrin repeat domain-containing protein [Campylobacterota bacterium]
MPHEISQQEERRYEELQLTALDFARDGNTKELKKMLDYGMSVNLCTPKNDSLIMLSSYKGHLETTKMLIEKGADINKINARGQTPLDGVCFKGNLNMVKLLVENSANIDGNPIIFATIFGNKDIVHYLKEKGLNKKSLKILGISVEFISSFISSIKSLFKAKNPVKKIGI